MYVGIGIEMERREALQQPSPQAELARGVPRAGGASRRAGDGLQGAGGARAEPDARVRGLRPRVPRARHARLPPQGPRRLWFTRSSCSNGQSPGQQGANGSLCREVADLTMTKGPKDQRHFLTPWSWQTGQAVNLRDFLRHAPTAPHARPRTLGDKFTDN